MATEQPRQNPSDPDPFGRKHWTPEKDAKRDYKEGVYSPRNHFKSYLDRYRLEYEILERMHGRK
jgi:hypothetical protein